MATIDEAVKLNLDTWDYETDYEEYKKKNKNAVEFFKPYMVRGLVVDLGCGDGAATPFLISGHEYLGIDINPKKLAKVNALTHKAEIYAWLKKQPAKSIPNIFCHHVLEHTANPSEIVKEIGRVLKGVAYIEVPSEPTHDVHVSYIQTWEELVPSNMSLLRGESFQGVLPSFRVIFRRKK